MSGISTTRRQFLASIGAGSAMVGLGGCDGQVLGPGAGPPPIPPSFPDDLNMRLLNRVTFGPTPANIARMEELGYDAFLEEQLEPDRINDAFLERRLRSLKTLGYSVAKLLEQEEPERVAEDLVRARVLRAVYSERQLFERVVDFWTDHFNIYQSDDGTFLLKTVDDRDVIRANALRSFRALLYGSARSPAMLVYLDNATNFAGAPNENYARELLELHTVGVNAGYSQRDVEELARSLTGWSVGSEGSATGTFVFVDAAHDFDAKSVFGLSIPAGGGIDDGDRVLNYLADHASTAEFVATKLVRHFVAETAPRSVVDRVAEAFARTGGDVKAVLREVFSRASMELAEPKLKRPVHFICDLIRRTGAQLTADNEELGVWLYLMGHVPFRWPAPNGYPDAAGFWAPGLLSRWNFAAALAYGESGAPFDLLALVEREGATTPEMVIELWDRMLLSGAMPDEEREALRAYVAADPDDGVRLVYESFALAASLPSYQWH